MRRELSLLAGCLVAAAAILPAPASAEPRPAATGLDAAIETTYEGSGSSISWTTCGSTSESEGCFGGGSISGFTRACAMLESESSASGDIVTRNLYILDSGDGASPTVKLDVYEKVYTFSNGFVTTTITLANTITLPLAPGAAASCMMAANPNFLYAATSGSTQAAQVNLSDNAVVAVGGTSSSLPVTQITGSNAGYVIVTFGDGEAAGQSAFSAFSPDGAMVLSGGGAFFAGNAINGFQLR